MAAPRSTGAAMNHNSYAFALPTMLRSVNGAITVSVDCASPLLAGCHLPPSDDCIEGNRGEQDSARDHELHGGGER